MITKEDIKDMMDIQLTAFKEASTVLFQLSNSRIEEQTKLIYDFKNSLEFTQKELQDLKSEVLNLRSENAQLKKNAENDNLLVNKLQQQVANLEDYSRRKNIRVEGISDSPKENWQQTQSKVQQIIKEKLQLESVKVEYAHRISHHESNSNTPRTIIARLQHDTDRDMALRNSWRLKGTQTFINEDLSELTIQKRKEKMPEFKNARQQGKIAYFKKDKLIIKERKDDRTSGNPASTSPATTSQLEVNPNVSQLVNVFTPDRASGEKSGDHVGTDIQTTTDNSNRLRDRSNTKKPIYK